MTNDPNKSSRDFGAKEIVPKAYDDVLSPAAKAVGESLEKTVRMALRPVDGIVWTCDRAFDWVQQKVTVHFADHRIPPEDIISPSVEMIGRVLVGLQIAGPADDPLPRNMFAKLLASSMTRGNIQETHPAFAEILRQLVPDEARLLAVLFSIPYGILEIRCEAGCTKRPSPGIIYGFHDPVLPHMKREWKPLQSVVPMKQPRHLRFYLRHLAGIGLVEEPHYSEKLEDMKMPVHDYIKIKEECERSLSDIETGCPETHSFHKNVFIETITLTIWGSDFCRACATSDFYNSETKQFVLMDGKN